MWLAGASWGCATPIIDFGNQDDAATFVQGDASPIGLGDGAKIGEDAANGPLHDTQPLPETTPSGNDDASGPLSDAISDASAPADSLEAELPETLDSNGPDGVDTALPQSPCPAEMRLVESVCMDRWEAPNVKGELPLVMVTFYEAENWCKERGKRLCYDDEWTQACQGSQKFTYPYGNTHQPGVCNDDKIWRKYEPSKLQLWPWKAASTEIETLQQLWDKVIASGPNGQAVVDHLSWLYQGEPSGANPGCVSEYGVEDLVGSVEEWTRRRDGGSGADFSGNLKGRYWAEVRTCQGNVKVHGNAFRFYEIGFRCCRDPQ